MAGDTVYFVSDAHFGHGSDDGARIRRFGELATEVRRRGTALYIVGDLFDFWIEYGAAIRSDYFPVLHELRGLADAGVDVRYVAGNHDFAIDSFLQKAVGVTVTHGCVSVELQGRRVHISHGDRIGKNGASRLLDNLLRCKRLQAVYKMIHPDIGVRIGGFFSAASRKKGELRGEISAKDLQRYRYAAQARLASGKSDLVIYAHTHHAELISLDGGEYCNVGSWMGNYDYAILRGGRIQLLKWGNSAS